jgi:hypothetical protein
LHAPASGPPNPALLPTAHPLSGGGSFAAASICNAPQQSAVPLDSYQG